MLLSTLKTVFVLAAGIAIITCDAAAANHRHRHPHLKRQQLHSGRLLSDDDEYYTPPVDAEDLIGEELVNKDNAVNFANRMVAEAYRIWKSPSSAGWKVLENNTDIGFVSEGKPVKGVFAAARVNVTRGQGVIDVFPQALLGALLSPKGFAIIDPFSEAADHYLPPLDVFPTDNWRPQIPAPYKALMVAKTSAKSDSLADREFVVLNAVDFVSGLLVSKSIQHANWPGVSVYGKPAPGLGKPYNPKNVRALNTFALEITPVVQDGKVKSLVKIVNYADYTAPAPYFTSNIINKQFISALFDRFRLTAVAINSIPPPSESV